MVSMKDLREGGTNLVKTATVLGITITDISVEQLLQEISVAMVKNRRLTIGHVNIYAMNLACQNQSLQEALLDFDIVYCDGFGVKLGAILLGQTIQHRLTAPDFLNQLCQGLLRSNQSLFLLGSQPGVADKAAARLTANHPGLQIAGSQHGFFDHGRDSADNQAVIARINQSQASLLLVGFGMPKQELWVQENRSQLSTPVVMTVGALFDTVSGTIPRAPRLLTDHGLEWLARLVIEPRRLWKRYIIGNPVFFVRIVGQRWQQRK